MWQGILDALLAPVAQPLAAAMGALVLAAVEALRRALGVQVEVKRSVSSSSKPPRASASGKPPKPSDSSPKPPASQSSSAMIAAFIMCTAIAVGTVACSTHPLKIESGGPPAVGSETRAYGS